MPKDNDNMHPGGKQQAQQEDADQQPLIGQDSEYRSSEDTESTMPSTSQSLWRSGFLYVHLDVDLCAGDEAVMTDQIHVACACRLVWDSGVACIALASLCSSLGALSIKILGGRVPVFEVVVRPDVYVSLCVYIGCMGLTPAFCAQFIRSIISWGVTHLIGRGQGLDPLYGSRKRYPILAVRGFMGAVAMTLYYEAFERLMLGEAVRRIALRRVQLHHNAAFKALPPPVPALYGFLCKTQPSMATNISRSLLSQVPLASTQH